MNSIKILSKLTKFPLLDTIERFILLVMYDKHISLDEDKSITAADLSDLQICKKTALYNNLKKLQNHGLIDVIEKKYFITPKFLYEIGKIDWNELTVKQTSSSGFIKDFTMEKLDDFLTEEELAITRTQREELFDSFKKTSNISITLKEWFFDYFGSNVGAVLFNRFKNKNLEN